MRREGISYAHPLIVLVAYRQETAQKDGEQTEGQPGVSLRIGVAAGKSVGTAVERNYAKRRMREAIRPLIPYMVTGWDLLFLARRPQQQADFQTIQAAIQSVLRRAKLLKPFS
ncbi:MAG: hypothetical protein Fur0022_08300 [Anaerolineales bacterium]